MRRAVRRLARRNFGFAGTPIKDASDWDAAATQAIATARTHADAINGKNRDPLLTLRRLDAVSVALCSVLDPAALCLAAHDCADWRAAASGAAARGECVMEELNADKALASAAAACAAANNPPPSARRLSKKGILFFMPFSAFLDKVYLKKRYTFFLCRFRRF